MRLPMPAPATVAGLVRYLRGVRGGAELPERLLVAVNARQVGLDQPLQPGDEVALLPPMAGG